EEFQHLDCREPPLLLLVDKRKGCAGDRPSLLAGLVSKRRIERGRGCPIGVCDGRLKGLSAWRNEFSVPVFQRNVGKLAPDRVGVFDIADGAFSPRCEAGNSLIAFAPEPGWKLDRGVHSNLISPLGADPR